MVSDIGAFLFAIPFTFMFFKQLKKDQAAAKEAETAEVANE